MDEFANCHPGVLALMPPLTFGLDASRAARARRTGTETYALELIRAMARQLDAGQRLRLYTPHPPQHSDWPNSAQVETRVIPFPRLWTHLRLAAELRQNRPDALFVPAHVLPLHCPVPALVTVHDLGYRYYPQAHRRFDRRYLDWSTRRHTRVARHLLADSQATKADLVRFYHANPDRISVVYLGRDESLAPVTDAAQLAAARAKYGLPDDYLLYLGTLHPRKNLVRLVDAFAAAHLPQSIALVIAGQKGWLYDDIFARVEQLGLQQRVLFPGFVAEADKPALLSGARAYVFPSLFEGFGLPVLEAMACGAPVLTSNVSSLPEVAGEAALLVDPLDTGAIAARLGQIATNDTLRRRLIGQGFQQVQKFSWDAAAAQVLEILERMCE
jgi:glycosyltransferase involved in cell wall biosynthesis